MLTSSLELIRRRFSPDYYKALGAVDPMMDSIRANFEDRLRAANATDKKAGNMAATAVLLREIDGYESPWEKAREAQLTRNQAIAQRQADRAESQADRSYMFHQRELDTLAKPVNDLAARVGRLRATLDQGTPVADALVAPELLTVLAGGAGSGLRMSEAELQRIVNGRSNWEALKSAAQAWSLDPSKANSITPAQRQQINALVTHVERKLTAKRELIDHGYSALAGSEDAMEHRKIFDRTRKALLGADGAEAGAGSVVDGLVNKYGGGGQR
jgi:hypothetical protein